jgi:hypothetical protein
MGQQKKQAEPSQQPNKASDDGHLARLHPSLRAQFVPLPKAGETLTDDQLSAVFSGDLSALRDVVQLIRQQPSQNPDQ